MEFGEVDEESKKVEAKSVALLAGIIIVLHTHEGGGVDETDVRAMVRLLGEVAALPGTHFDKKRHLMEGLCRLTESGADASVILDGAGADVRTAGAGAGVYLYGRGTSIRNSTTAADPLANLTAIEGVFWVAGRT